MTIMIIDHLEPFRQVLNVGGEVCIHSVRLVYFRFMGRVAIDAQGLLIVKTVE